MPSAQGKRQELLQARSDLREELRKLRCLFIKQAGHFSYMVFDESTLDELTIHMPTNKKELLEVDGFGEKRFKHYGLFILGVIQEYAKRETHADSTTSAGDEPIPQEVSSSYGSRE